MLSSRQYNKVAGLLICCPTSTSIRGTAVEVAVDNLEKPSVVASSLIQTLSWKDRKVSYITAAKNGVIDQALVRIIPFIGADSVIEKFIE